MNFKKRKRPISLNKANISDGMYEIKGIYSKAEFHAILSYELTRAARKKNPFSVILLHIPYNMLVDRRIMSTFLNHIRTNIRNIDVIGWWDINVFAILLPASEFDGAKKCSEKLFGSDSIRTYDFSYTIYSYPDRWIENTYSIDNSSDPAENADDSGAFEKNAFHLPTAIMVFFSWM